MKLTIETAENGWIVTEQGKNKTPRVFFLWHQLNAFLESMLTNKGKQTCPSSDPE